MAEIEFGIPTVQFGYLHIKATLEELGMKEYDPYAIGHAYGVALNLAMQGFEASKKLDLNPGDVTGQYQESSEYKVGDKVTVGGIEFTKHSEFSPELSIEQARDVIESELGPTSEVPESSGAGSEKQSVSDGSAPWEGEAPAPKAEPWKTGPKIKPATIEW